MSKTVIEIDNDLGIATVTVAGELIEQQAHLVYNMRGRLESEGSLLVGFMKEDVENSKRSIELLRRLPYCRLEQIEVL